MVATQHRGVHTKGFDSLGQVVSQVPSNLRMFYYSKSSQSVGKITLVFRQSGFSVNSLSFGLLKDVVLLYLGFRQPTRSVIPSARTVASLHLWGSPSHPQLELTLGIGPDLRGGGNLWVGHSQPLVPLCRHFPVPSVALLSMTYKFFLALTLCSLVWLYFS